MNTLVGRELVGCLILVGLIDMICSTGTLTAHPLVSCRGFVTKASLIPINE